MSEEIESHIHRKFEIHQKLGKGAYGVVWKATEKKSGKTVALKKVFEAFQNSTDAQRTFREVMILQEIDGHENIVRLLNVIRAENNKDLYLVFEFMETDLHAVIKAGILTPIHKQYIIYQILKGLKYLHSGQVVHRDLKPSNVLINTECLIKIADFGLARSVAMSGTEGDPIMTEYVATRWYRAPEIVLGSSTYSKAVDVWSVGCILAELVNGKALFPGKSTLNQVELILEVLGRPTEKELTGLDLESTMNILSSIQVSGNRRFEQCFKTKDPQTLDFLRRTLTFSQEERMTVEEALKHPFLENFRDSEELKVLDREVSIPIDENTRFSISVYRDALYNEIIRKKKEQRRKWKEEYLKSLRLENAGRDSRGGDLETQKQVEMKRKREGEGKQTEKRHTLTSETKSKQKESKKPKHQEKDRKKEKHQKPKNQKEGKEDETLQGFAAGKSRKKENPSKPNKKSDKKALKESSGHEKKLKETQNSQKPSNYPEHEQKRKPRKSKAHYYSNQNHRVPEQKNKHRDRFTTTPHTESEMTQHSQTEESRTNQKESEFAQMKPEKRKKSKSKQYKEKKSDKRRSKKIEKTVEPVSLSDSEDLFKDSVDTSGRETEGEDLLEKERKIREKIEKERKRAKERERARRDREKEKHRREKQKRRENRSKGNKNHSKHDNRKMSTNQLIQNNKYNSYHSRYNNNSSNKKRVLYSSKDSENQPAKQNSPKGKDMMELYKGGKRGISDSKNHPSPGKNVTPGSSFKNRKGSKARNMLAKHYHHPPGHIPKNTNAKLRNGGGFKGDLRGRSDWGDLKRGSKHNKSSQLPVCGSKSDLLMDGSKNRNGRRLASSKQAAKENYESRSKKRSSKNLTSKTRGLRYSGPSSRPKFSQPQNFHALFVSKNRSRDKKRLVGDSYLKNSQKQSMLRNIQRGSRGSPMTNPYIRPGRKHSKMLFGQGVFSRFQPPNYGLYPREVKPHIDETGLFSGKAHKMSQNHGNTKGSHLGSGLINPSVSKNSKMQRHYSGGLGHEGNFYRATLHSRKKQKASSNAKIKDRRAPLHAKLIKYRSRDRNRNGNGGGINSHKFSHRVPHGGIDGSMNPGQMGGNFFLFIFFVERNFIWFFYFNRNLNIHNLFDFH